ncbi:hypothetical protein EZV62_018464 [Acer yangbiense]|uniref:Bet v I/Major latex protein domain-containing protein n=1 Tax=Acer yangbiense TaxID=1000413 RepID=A0A5C7HJG2_9ROSI|nr:hypothetical protein EZV62_018464 [Acer yangbiense]
MSLICQLETDIEIKAPADKFHEVFSCRPHHMSNVSPEKIQGVELHEGHLLEKYKDFDATVQVTPKKDGGSLVHWTVKYEKASKEAPDAKGIIQLVTDMTKDLDAHLIEQA